MRKWISLLMVLSVIIAAFLTDISLHSLAGFLFLAAVFFHVRINFQVYRAYAKNKKFKNRFLVNNLLLIFWVVSFLAAIPTVLAFFHDRMTIFPQNIHGITAFIGALLIVVHLIQHRQQASRYFK